MRLATFFRRVDGGMKGFANGLAAAGRRRLEVGNTVMLGQVYCFLVCDFPRAQVGFVAHQYDRQLCSPLLAHLASLDGGHDFSHGHKAQSVGHGEDYQETVAGLDLLLATHVIVLRVTLQGDKREIMKNRREKTSVHV